MVVCNVQLWYEIKCHGINVQSSWDDMVRHYGAVIHHVCTVILHKRSGLGWAEGSMY